MVRIGGIDDDSFGAFDTLQNRVVLDNDLDALLSSTGWAECRVHRLGFLRMVMVVLEGLLLSPLVFLHSAGDEAGNEGGNDEHQPQDMIHT